MAALACGDGTEAGTDPGGSAGSQEEASGGSGATLGDDGSGGDADGGGGSATGGGGTGGGGGAGGGGGTGGGSGNDLVVTDLSFYNEGDGSIFERQVFVDDAPSDSGLTSDALEGCPDTTDSAAQPSLDGKTITFDQKYAEHKGFYSFLNDSYLRHGVWTFTKTGTAGWVVGCIEYENAEIGTFTLKDSDVTGHYLYAKLSGDSAYFVHGKGRQYLQVTIGGTEKYTMYLTDQAYINAHYFEGTENGGTFGMSYSID